MTNNRDSCTDKWRTFTSKRNGQSNMDAFCELIEVDSMEVTADNDSGQLLEFLTHVVTHKDKFSRGVNTAVVQDFRCAADLSSVVSAAFRVLHYERGGYMKLRVRTDGRLAKNQEPVPILDLLGIADSVRTRSTFARSVLREQSRLVGGGIGGGCTGCIGAGGGVEQ